jgi:hypothetical protein
MTSHEFRSFKCKIHVIYMALWLMKHSRHSRIVTLYECKCGNPFCRNAYLRCSRCQQEVKHECYEDKL